ASIPSSATDDFRAHGWGVADPESVAPDCKTFQEFVSHSAAEFTVAKQIYAGIPSGWFSDRRAAYLASARPVVTQATGFEHWLPLGEGLHSFRTPDQAADAILKIRADLAKNCRAARHLAEQHFDSSRVLSQLLGYVI